MSYPGGTVVKNLPATAGNARDRFDPWVGKIPWTRKWQPAPAFLPGKFHRPRSLIGYSTWGCKELDMTEHAHTQTHTHTQICYIMQLYHLLLK